MSAIQWAKTIRCDWPECQNEVEITLASRWPETITPEDWLIIYPDAIINHLGERFSEFCPTHADKSIRELRNVMLKSPPDKNQQ